MVVYDCVATSWVSKRVSKVVSKLYSLYWGDVPKRMTGIVATTDAVCIKNVGWVKEKTTLLGAVSFYSQRLFVASVASGFVSDIQLKGHQPEVCLVEIVWIQRRCLCPRISHSEEQPVLPARLVVEAKRLALNLN